MGYATIKGKIIIPPIYQALVDTRENPKFLVASKYIDETKVKIGLLDKDNNIIIPFDYDLIEKTESDNLFIAIKGDWNNDEKNVKSGVYNAKGELIIPVNYFGDIRIIKGKTQDFISVAVNEKYGIMNDKGKFIIDPKFSFEELLKLEEKLRDK